MADKQSGTPDAGQTDTMMAAMFAMADGIRQLAEALEGQVSHLKANGWTDDQARAIVAATMGWRPTTPEADA